MNFPLASPSEGSSREPGYQSRIELYAQNYFTPAQYQKIKSRGINFVRGDADMIRHAFIGEDNGPDSIKRKVQRFTGSAYVYDLAHALLLQVKRTVQQLVNVPEGLDVNTLLSVLYNLKGFKLMRGGGEAPKDVQLMALSSTDYKAIASLGRLRMKGVDYRPVRVPSEAAPSQAYPWSLTSTNKVAVDCVVAEMIELCRARNIPTANFSVVQRSQVFAPLELDSMPSQNQILGSMAGQSGADSTFGYASSNFAYDASIATETGPGGSFPNVIRAIQLPAGQSYGPTSVAGLDEVFRMETERDAIISVLTQWGTTGLGIILDANVDYDKYRSPGGNAANIMGNKPAYSRFAEVNEMGDSCGPGYERVWYTGDPSSDKSRQVPGHIVVNGVKYQNPQAQRAVCAPMTRQLRSMPYTTDVVTNPTMATAAQRRYKRRKPRAAPKRRKTTKRRTRK